MATATSRISLDPPLSLIDIPPLVNPHPLPNHHVRLPDLAPSPTGRLSSDSQAPGRTSPSPRKARRAQVPFLLEAFPAPPSHIPGTPISHTPSSLLNSPSLLASATSWASSACATSPVSTNPVSPTSPNAMSPCSPKSVAATLTHSNPPPSSPPSGPLPPVPVPSSVTPDLFAAQRSLPASARPTSPAPSTSESLRSQSRTETRPRLSNDSVRGRGRQGSLSSLRNPIYPKGEQSVTIAEEPVQESRPTLPASLVAPHSPPLFGSVTERRSHDQSRGDSPDILRSSLSRATATPLRLHDKTCAEDSIASVDMSDLNALRSDNEGDGEDQTSLPFPRCPPLPRSQAHGPPDRPPSAPSCGHTPRKPSKSSDYSMHVPSTSEDAGSRHGALSPEITQMISATPRPRKRSTPSQSHDSSSTRNRKDSSRSRGGGDVPPVPTSSHIAKTAVRKATRRNGGNEANRVSRGEEANESDSSLDLHTPLP